MIHNRSLLSATTLGLLGALLVLGCATGGTAAERSPAGSPPPAAGVSRAIDYKITSKVWNSVTGMAEDTPPALVSKIGRIFTMWGSVPGSGLSFHYAGLAAAAYSSFDQVPTDGCIYIVLNGDYPFAPLDKGGPAGAGGFHGTIPGDYKGGFVFMSTKVAGLYTLRYNILAHEIGHTLGLLHSATNTSVMFCGSQAWGDEEYLHLSQQDRLNLSRLWPGPGSLHYVVSGTVSGAVPWGGGYGVSVVDVTTGHAYSALTGTASSGRQDFGVVIGGPGDYRVVATANPMNTSKPMAESASWYVKGGGSTNDPYAGTVIHVAEGQESVTGISIVMVKQPSPFNLFWSAPYQWGKPEAIPTFLLPGTEVKFYLMFNEGAISTLEPYGSAPDISITKQGQGDQVYSLTVAARADAQPGDRLLVGRGAAGQSVHVGLVGIHVVSKRPDLVKVDSRCKNENDWVHYQIKNNVDFSTLAADF